MTVYEYYETPDGVDVPKRQPAQCPYCGHDGAFDGQGGYADGSLHHCPNCDLQFVTFLPGESV